MCRECLQAHDFAAKAAKTDANKRALMTFGNAFGLSLDGGAPAEPVSGQRDPTAGGCQRNAGRPCRGTQSGRPQRRKWTCLMD